MSSSSKSTGIKFAKSIAALAVGLLAFSGCSMVSGETAEPSSAPSQLLESAIEAQTSGDTETAKIQLQDIVDSVDPVEEPELVTTALFNLGVIAQRANNLEEAIGFYKRALVVVPDYKPALFNIAIALTPIDAYAAQTYYSMLVTISPKDANALYNFGLLKYQMGDEDGGRKLLKRALEVAPELSEQLPDDIVL